MKRERWVVRRVNGEDVSNSHIRAPCCSTMWMRSPLAYRRNCGGYFRTGNVNVLEGENLLRLMVESFALRGRV